MWSFFLVLLLWGDAKAAPWACTRECGIESACDLQAELEHAKDFDVICVSPFSTSHDYAVANMHVPVAKSFATPSKKVNAPEKGPYFCARGRRIVHQYTQANVTARAAVVQSACVNIPAHVALDRKPARYEDAYDPRSLAVPFAPCTALFVASQHFEMHNVVLDGADCMHRFNDSLTPLINATSMARDGVGAERRLILRNTTLQNGFGGVLWSADSRSEDIVDLADSFLADIVMVNMTQYFFAAAHYRGVVAVSMAANSKFIRWGPYPEHDVISWPSLRAENNGTGIAFLNEAGYDAVLADPTHPLSRGSVLHITRLEKMFELTRGAMKFDFKSARMFADHYANATSGLKQAKAESCGAAHSDNNCDTTEYLLIAVSTTLGLVLLGLLAYTCSHQHRNHSSLDRARESEFDKDDLRFQVSDHFENLQQQGQGPGLGHVVGPPDERTRRTYDELRREFQERGGDPDHPHSQALLRRRAIAASGSRVAPAQRWRSR